MPNNPRFDHQLAREMLHSGMTLQAVGDHFGVSRERIRQIGGQQAKQWRDDRRKAAFAAKHRFRKRTHPALKILCKLEGCNNPSHIRGMCDTHYCNWRYHSSDVIRLRQRISHGRWLQKKKIEDPQWWKDYLAKQQKWSQIWRDKKILGLPIRKRRPIPKEIVNEKSESAAGRRPEENGTTGRKIFKGTASTTQS